MSNSNASLIEPIFSKINQLVVEVYKLEGGRFLSMLKASKTLGERYDAILAFDYAANSKELRDTSDETVHSLLNAVSDAVDSLNSFMRIDFFPASNDQKNMWVNRLIDCPHGKYAFRDNGAIQVSILDSRLAKDTLHIGRIWSHVSDYSGSHVNFTLPLSQQQISEFKERRILLSAVSCIDDFLYE